LRLIKQVTGAAKRAGKPVSMCGDMAGDPRFCWVLLGLGLRSLSMAPRQIPIVKSIVRGTRIASAEKLTEEILRLRTEDEVEELVNRVMKERFPIEFTEETS
jgi:phosphotransferase system enzyme I (PtsI)